MRRMLAMVCGLTACGSGAGGDDDAGGDDGSGACPPTRGEAPYTYIKSDNTHADDQFGAQLALARDGATLAVSSPFAGLAPSGTTAGAVSIYTRCGAGWAARAWIARPSDMMGGIFGVSLALAADGATLAVGALDASAGTRSGSVYVYRRTGSAWQPQAHVTGADTVAHDAFGNSVALSAAGDVLAVGAPSHQGEAGAVYVFTRADTTWTQQAALHATPTLAASYLGQQVALSADGATLVASAPNEPLQDAPDDSFGAAYVFGGPTWQQQARLEPIARDASVHFASAIALSDDGATVAASAFTAPQDPGSVNVFARGASWDAQASLVIPAPSAAFNYYAAYLALSGDGSALLAGVASDRSSIGGIDGDPSDASAPDSGAVYRFARTGAAWQQQHRIKPAHPQAGAQFGNALAISSDAATAAIGAPFEASASTGVDSGGELDTSARDAGAVFALQ